MFTTVLLLWIKRAPKGCRDSLKGLTSNICVHVQSHDLEFYQPHFRLHYCILEEFEFCQGGVNRIVPVASIVIYKTTNKKQTNKQKQNKQKTKQNKKKFF